MAVEAYRELFEAAGKKHNVDPALLETIAWQESRGNPKAVSEQGALGLMQMMPATAKRLGVNPLKEAEAVDGAARLIAESLDRNNGDLESAIGEYHGGPNRKIWGPKNERYRREVLARYTGAAPSEASVTPDDVAKAFGATGATEKAVTPQDVAKAFASPETVTATSGKPAPPTSPQARRSDEALGFQKGIAAPLDAGAIWLEEGAKKLGIDTDAINRLVGLPSAKEARAQRMAALAEKEAAGIKPGMLGELTGNVVGTLPVALATRNPFIVGGASGALTSRDPTSIEETAQSAGWGAAGGKVGDMLVSGAGKVIAPKLAPAVQKLMGEGVEMTPGQLLGGFVKSAEDKMTSLPIVGDMIKNAQGRSMESFNGAVLNRVLAPINQSLPKGMSGRDAITHVGDAVSKAYDDALTGVTVKADKAFATDMGDAMKRARLELPEALATRAQAVAKDILTLKMAKGGTMTADAVKEAEEKLGTMIRRYSGAADPDQRAFAEVLGDVRDNFRELVVRNNPQVAAKLKAANTAFANLVRVEKAAASLGAEGGTFTPAQLLNAVKAADTSVRKKATARGSALMQDIAEAGKSTLPSKVPDSGTPGRMLFNLLVGGGGVAGAGALGVAPQTLAAAGALMAPYTRMGGRGIQMLLGQRPAGAQAVRQGLERARLPAAMAAGATAAQARPQKRPAK